MSCFVSCLNCVYRKSFSCKGQLGLWSTEAEKTAEAADLGKSKSLFSVVVISYQGKYSRQIESTLYL